MGIRPTIREELFGQSSLQANGGHDVLLDNFMNAQCTIPKMNSYPLG